MKFPVLNKKGALDFYKKRIYRKHSFDEFVIYHIKKEDQIVNGIEYTFYKTALISNLEEHEIVIAISGFNFQEYYYTNCIINYFRKMGINVGILDLSNISCSFVKYLKKKKLFENQFFLEYPFFDIRYDLNSRFSFVKEFSKFLNNPLKDFSPKTEVISFSPLLSYVFLDLGIKNIVNVIYQYKYLENSLCLSCENLFLSSSNLVESSFLLMKDKRFNPLKDLNAKNFIGGLMDHDFSNSFSEDLFVKKNSQTFNVILNLTDAKSFTVKRCLTYLIRQFKKNPLFNLYLISENKKDIKIISRNLTYQFNLEHFDLDIEKFLSDSGKKEHSIEFIYNDNHFHTALAIQKLLSKADLYICEEGEYLDLPIIKMVYSRNKSFQLKISSSSSHKDFLFFQNLKEFRFLLDTLTNKKENLYQNLTRQLENKFKNNFYSGVESILKISNLKKD